MGLAALADDYLFLGPLIAKRLYDQVPDVPVDVIETVEQLLAADKRAVVLMAMYAGDRIPEAETGRASAGSSQVIHQRWLAVLALNNVGSAKDARQLRAGQALSQMHKALAGWTPPGCTRPFVRVNAPMRPQFTPQKATYPLGFEISMTL